MYQTDRNYCRTQFVKNQDESYQPKKMLFDNNNFQYEQRIQANENNRMKFYHEQDKNQIYNHQYNISQYNNNQYNNQMFSQSKNDLHHNNTQINNFIIEQNRIFNNQSQKMINGLQDNNVYHCYNNQQNNHNIQNKSQHILDDQTQHNNKANKYKNNKQIFSNQQNKIKKQLFDSSKNKNKIFDHNDNKRQIIKPNQLTDKISSNLSQTRKSLFYNKSPILQNKQNITLNQNNQNINRISPLKKYIEEIKQNTLEIQSLNLQTIQQQFTDNISNQLKNDETQSKNITEFSSVQAQKEQNKYIETQSQPIFNAKKTGLLGLKQSISGYFLNFDNNNETCQCIKSEGKCQRAQAWIQYFYPDKLEVKLQQEYYDIIDMKQTNDQAYDQIMKDINRSYPDQKYFQQGNKGFENLKSILIAYSKYDPQLSYTQGMNLLAGCILYHCEDYIAFWIFTSLLQKSNLRDVYIKDLPGHAKHSEMIEFLMFTQQSEIYQHFCQNNITASIFISPWLFSLFSIMIPIKFMGYFLDYFIEQEWIYFYKLVMMILIQNKQEILKQDQAEILMFLTKNNNRNKSDINWIKLFEKANEIKLDQNFISQMHKNFDSSKKTFKI